MTCKFSTNFKQVYKSKATVKFSQKQLSILKSGFSKFTIVLNLKKFCKIYFEHYIGKNKLQNIHFLNSCQFPKINSAKGYSSKN